MKNFFKSHVKLCIAVLALSLVTVGATLALMVSPSNSVTNQFTAADVDTEINEVLTSGSKQVSITNHGRSDAYVRARIMVSGVDLNNVQIVDTVPTDDKLALEENKGKVFLVMNNQNKWVQEPNAEKDDFYYYLDVLPGSQPNSEPSETSDLLTKVVLGSDLQSDQDFLANFTVTIYHESVLAIDQSAPIDVAKVKSAFDAAAGSTTNP